MRKRGYFIYIVLFCLLVTAPITVLADMGPKPSVVIAFEGLENEEYYVTLLSESDSTGPWSLGNDYYEYMGNRSAFQKFSEYQDAGGYYFLSYMEDCSEDDTFEWTYYPPSPFKILIYFPEQDTFLAPEGIYERYAFDSYYTVTVSEEKVVVDTCKSYDYSMELLSLLARVLATIVIEVLLALAFGYRRKKPLVIITVTNIFTQVLLNILLNVINYQSGQYAFVFHYVWMEIVVFFIEALVYDKLIGRENEITKKKYRPYWYAAVANIVSFLLGMWIARAIPGIF